MPTCQGARGNEAAYESFRMPEKPISFDIWSPGARPRLGPSTLSEFEARLLTTLRALPKTELHIHVEGSIPLVELAAPAPTPDGSFFEQWFRVINALQDQSDFATLAAGFVGRLKRAGVVWAEVFVSPPDLAMRPREPIDFSRSLLAWVRAFDGVSFPGTEVRIIVDLERLYPLENVQSWLDQVFEIRAMPGGDRIVGIGFGGPQDANPLTTYRKVMERAMDRGLLVVAHAGEMGSPQDVSEAVALGVQRLGHAVGLRSADAAYARVLNDRIAIEACPDSNLVTGSIREYHDHPVAKWLTDGALVTVCTDDPTILRSECCLQFLHLHRAFGWGYSEFRQILLNGVDASLMPEASKHTVRAAIIQGCRDSSAADI